MDASERIVEYYTQQLREHGHAPQSVFRLCKDLDLTEADFFKIFGSLDAVESELWRRMIDLVIGSVSAGVEWESFGARQKTLAFLFAFLETSLEMRSLMLARKELFRPLGRKHALAGFFTAHKRFMADVIEKGRENGEVAERGALTGVYPEVFLTHLLAVIEFHLSDTSPSFERTDAFVEKTVNLAFDLIRTQAVDSAFDLARFLIPRR